MMRFDKSDRDVLAVCACGWRHHAAAGDTAASMAQADSAAMDHIYRAHAVDELERGRAIAASYTRKSRNTR